jgi:hypothetical protein
MSEKEDNIIDFQSKSQERQKSEISDVEFQMFLNALLGPYKGGGYQPE